eukprot:SAG31_NODE_2590_length_5426_cov_4.118265_6_plen_93_part_00
MSNHFADRDATAELTGSHEGVAQANAGLAGTTKAGGRSAKARRQERKNKKGEKVTTNPMVRSDCPQPTGLHRYFVGLPAFCVCVNGDARTCK